LQLDPAWFAAARVGAELAVGQDARPRRHAARRPLCVHPQGRICASPFG